MRQNTNYLLIGSFVLVASGIAVVTALFLGAGALNSDDKRTLETYIRESVQGLDVGAHVRFRGVRIGQVTQISLTSHEYGSDEPLVLVRFDVRPLKGMTVHEMDDVINERINGGLRTQLSSQGLTGALYLEADVYDDADRRFPPMKFAWTPRFRYVPSIPSRITQLSDSVAGVLENLERANTAELIGDARGAITSLRDAIEGVDTKGLSAKLGKLTESATAFLDRTSDSIARVEASTVGTLEDVRTRIAAVDPARINSTLESLEAFSRELAPASESLRETLAQIELAAQATRGIVEGRARELDELLDDVRRISASFANLAETLEQYPSLLFLGNPPERSKR